MYKKEVVRKDGMSFRDNLFFRIQLVQTTKNVKRFIRNIRSIQRIKTLSVRVFLLIVLHQNSSAEKRLASVEGHKTFLKTNKSCPRNQWK
ncbi:hypothetical protein HMPREF9372_3610 [Sporosarcina newyorkensis 2681]|uniref:Uncharacterized protein n=1 Tax=Sporosarcina newyorkensis 2681 TaxID=1027292 RepID=F9DXS9_9BACL|nr:hypothetical protein HMPREF9372_3610 [Sporosarcina newyorkensis 2681]